MSNNLEDSMGFDLQPGEEIRDKEIINNFKSIKYNTKERDKTPKTNNMHILNSNNIKSNPFSLHKDKGNIKVIY